MSSIKEKRFIICIREKDVSQKKSLDKYILKLLNQYYLMPEDHQDKLKIFNELRQQIYSPALVVNCDFIPADDDLMKDALILSDAFESLTNGMIDETALMGINKISEKSLLYPWCPFTRGIISFYESDHKNCLKHLNRIPENSAPAAFRIFFKALLTNDMIHEKSGTLGDSHWSRLKESILESNRVIEDSIQLIQESVGMEDLLLESAGLLIRDIINVDRESAQKIILWCFDKLQLSDILSDRAVLKARQLFGEEDGYRLASVGSLPFDPDRALVYWLHSLLSYLNGHDTDITNVKASLSILKDISDTVQLEFELTSEYLHLIGSLVSDLSERILHIYPDFPGNMGTPEDPFAAIAQLNGTKKTQSAQRKVREIKTEAVQLELFAF